MHVLFASGIDGFCHRYAVLHWAEQLATRGIASTVRAHVDPRLAGDLADHDLLVLYRVPFSPWIARLIEWARARGRTTVFAIDDLIVDPAAPMPPAVERRSDGERAAWQEGVLRYHATMRACRVFLGTTAPLRDYGRAAEKPAYLHRGGLGDLELALGARAAAARTAPPARPFRLGYFSGTPTHDDDLAAITPVLVDLLDARPALELVVGGTVALDPALARFGARVQHRPLVPWPELPALLAEVDVNLAPLDWRHPFAAAKGAVKYLEAAAIGVPTVASPTEAFRHAISDGTNGLLAADAAAWQRTLAALTDDPARAARLGAVAREDVRRRFGPAMQGADLETLLRECMARRRRTRARGPEPAPPTPADELTLAASFPGELARAAREPHGLPNLPAPAVDGTTAPLGDGVVLSQPFTATHAGLVRVDVHSVTYGQQLAHDLELRLRRDDDGAVVAAERLPAVLAPDRDWLALALPRQADSAGRRYTLELEAYSTGAGNALSFGTVPVPAGGTPYRLAGEPESATLALRTFTDGLELEGAAP